MLATMIGILALGLAVIAAVVAVWFYDRVSASRLRVLSSLEGTRVTAGVTAYGQGRWIYTVEGILRTVDGSGSHAVALFDFLHFMPVERQSSVANAQLEVYAKSGIPLRHIISADDGRRHYEW